MQQWFCTCIFCEHQSVGVIKYLAGKKVVFNGFIVRVSYWHAQFLLRKIKYSKNDLCLYKYCGMYIDYQTIFHVLFNVVFI